MNILIIAPSWVGDLMMSHSLLQTLKRRSPDAQIDVLAPAWCRPLLARMPEVRTALEMPLGHGAFALGERYRLGRSLRGRYDLAITLPNSWKSALIPLFAGIAARRGWIGESRYGLLNDWRKGKERYPRMVQRYVALAYEKNAEPDAEAMDVPPPYLRVESDFSGSFLRQHGSSGSALAAALNSENAERTRPIVGFCPGAEFGPAKRWPHYHYAELAGRLIGQGCRVRLFGSPKDAEACAQIQAALPEAQRVFCTDLAGKTDLTQAVDLIAECTAVVSNDSGLMHIAAAVNRPVIALYGPTSPEYTPPLSDKAVVLRTIGGGLIKIRKGDAEGGYHQSLIDLQPQTVWDELKRRLPLLTGR